MDTSCIAVFTSKIEETLVADGGSQSWRLNLRKAHNRRFLVCCWNAGGDFPLAIPGYSNGEAYLVAPIKSIAPSLEATGRHIIKFDRFARVRIPKAWPRQRYPISYSTLTDMGINLNALKFEEITESVSAQRSPTDETVHSPLTIEAAKIGIAQYFGVPVTAIEIVIRG